MCLCVPVFCVCGVSFCICVCAMCPLRSGTNKWMKKWMKLWGPGGLAKNPSERGMDEKNSWRCRAMGTISIYASLSRWHERADTQMALLGPRNNVVHLSTRSGPSALTARSYWNTPNSVANCNISRHFCKTQHHYRAEGSKVKVTGPTAISNWRLVVTE